VANAIVARRARSRRSSRSPICPRCRASRRRASSRSLGTRAAPIASTRTAPASTRLAGPADDRGAILTFANTASLARFTAALRFRPEVVGPQRVAARPFTTLQQLVDMYDIGPASFRAIRDAALVGPFDLLVAAVNNLHREVTISTDFDPYALLFSQEQPGQLAGLECLGIDPAPGLADRASQAMNQTFHGCYAEDVPNPWCGFGLASFVNTQIGYRARIDSGWCE
jgi:hypothetical protein